MMKLKDFTKETKYRKLLERFLNPREENRSEVSRMIDVCFSEYNMPNTKEEPFLSIAKDKARIDAEIPIKGRPGDNVLKEASTFLDGAIRWHSPAVMHNINPTILLDSVALSAITNIYNPNMIWDYVSADLQNVERNIMKQLGSLVGWNKVNVDGVFTYGGKGCLTYAIRMGLSRTIPGYATKGKQDYKPVVITSKFNHYIIESVCNLLGIGTEACIRIDTDKNEIIKVDQFREKLLELKNDGFTVAAIIMSGGSTLNLNIDPVDEVREVVNAEYEDPETRPFIYFDSVVSWPWFFWLSYDFGSNELGIGEEVLRILEKTKKRMSVVLRADAYGVDLHKMGFAAYSNSAIVVKNKEDLHSIFSDERLTKKRNDFGNNFLQSHTIEHSRSGVPIISAWSVFQTLGYDGFRMYLAQLMSVGTIFRKILPCYGFELVNEYSLCHVSVFFPSVDSLCNSLSELKTLDDEDRNEAISNYIYELTEFIANNNNPKEFNVVLGFLKVLPIPGWDKSISAIRVYPMSPFTSLKQAEDYAHSIGRLKKEFDNDFRHNGGEAPDVIHR